MDLESGVYNRVSKQSQVRPFGYERVSVVVKGFEGEMVPFTFLDTLYFEFSDEPNLLVLATAVGEVLGVDDDMFVKLVDFNLVNNN